jgi:Uncharacterized conserved protein
MSKIVDFLKDCVVFYVLTINDDFPAGRPFGAVMEYENNLYISTGDTKAVYQQLKQNSNMQIIAIKPRTREWVRISGIAEECFDLNMKQKMLEECPVLTKHFSSPVSPHYSVFQVKVVDSNIY